MIGAILGDIIGSPYEFDQGKKTKDFPLFPPQATYTDDTVMTLAVAQAFLDAAPGMSDEAIQALLAQRMRAFGKAFPHAGYGGRFRLWLEDPGMEPYGSYGNGSAMRVSSVAWMFDTLESVRHAARLSAQVTHNHPEGIKEPKRSVLQFLWQRTENRKKKSDSISASTTTIWTSRWIP